MSLSEPSSIRDICMQVAKLPVGEREGALQRLCKGNAALLKKVRAILAAQGNTSNTIFDQTETGQGSPPEISAQSAQPDFAAIDGEEKPGSHIGPYKLLQQIGEGGFGSVFVAEQERPVRRTVALKIIKLGMDTRQVVARFEQERQALALMDHPNIAHVLDAGATKSGRPYFVMELCRGEPITVYCDRNNVSVPDRLALFVQVWTNNLGGLLCTEHKSDQAEPLLRDGLERTRRVNGPDHPTTIAITHSLCDVLESEKRYSDLAPLYRQIVASRRRAENPDPDSLRFAVDDLARTLENLGGDSLAEALSLYEESIQLSRKKYGDDNWRTGISTARRGRTLMKLRRFTEAEDALTAGYKILSAPSEASIPGRQSLSDIFVTFYQTWDKAEPGKGHDAKAEQWKVEHQKQLAATRPSTRHS